MQGKPFLGVISGFFFGLFGGVALFLFGVIPLDSHLLWILPILGIVFGLFMATLAPFGSSTSPTAETTAGVTYASAGDADSSATLTEEPATDPDPGEEPPTPSNT
ncbi:MAG: hypothetical protein M3132_03175 [Actinomycetia bacterium]|nr:hypothetical protein [Actinomycetes bacterium]